MVSATPDKGVLTTWNNGLLWLVFSKRAKTINGSCIFFSTGLEENEDDLYLDYTMLPAALSKNYDVEFVEQETLITKRWKPDDLKV